MTPLSLKNPSGIIARVHGKDGQLAAEAESPLIYLSTHYIRAKEYLESILAATSDAICTTDMQGRVIYFGPGAEKMFGKSAREIAGLSVHQLYEAGRKEADRVMKMLLRKGSLKNYETVAVSRGRRIHISMSAALLKDRSGRCIGTLGISKDITRRVELEQQLLALSLTDELTGLYNHRHYHERIAGEVQRARRQRQRLSLVVIDLDRFKEVNDRLGHVSGDRVLRHLAGAITRSIRKDVDMGFRYGGDEFVVVLPGLGQRKALVVARRIAGTFRSTVAQTGVDFSFGLASLRSGENAEDCFRRADVQMYRDKQHKKNRLF